MEWLDINAETVAQAVVIVVTAASAVAALFPKPKKSKLLTAVYKLINALAVNVRHAKNKEDV